MCEEVATSRLTLWPNGIVDVNVVLGTRTDGRDLTADELDAWVATFPIKPM